MLSEGPKAPNLDISAAEPRDLGKLAGASPEGCHPPDSRDRPGTFVLPLPTCLTPCKRFGERGGGTHAVDFGRSTALPTLERQRSVAGGFSGFPAVVWLRSVA